MEGSDTTIVLRPQSWLSLQPATPASRRSERVHTHAHRTGIAFAARRQSRSLRTTATVETNVPPRDYTSGYLFGGSSPKPQHGARPVDRHGPSALRTDVQTTTPAGQSNMVAGTGVEPVSQRLMRPPGLPAFPLYSYSESNGDRKSYEDSALPLSYTSTKWSGVPVSNRVIDLGKVARKPSRTRRIWWSHGQSKPKTVFLQGKPADPQLGPIRYYRLTASKNKNPQRSLPGGSGILAKSGRRPTPPNPARLYSACAANARK